MIRLLVLSITSVFQVMSKTGQWFYGVKKGRVPGVYKSWTECENQVRGFNNPAFRKFTSFEEAQEFINGKNDKSSSFTTFHNTSVPSSSQGNILLTSSSPCNSKVTESEFEILKGSIQRIVGEVEQLKTGLVQLRTAITRIEGAVFIAPGFKRSFCTSTQGPSEDEDSKIKRPKFNYDADYFTGQTFEAYEGTHVYTDGGCFDNGKNCARAGIGVYWSEDDSDNVSERLPGRPTNNRAEIHAAIRAVQIAKKKGINNLILHTDSQFLINGITKWIRGWKRNQWVKATGSPVINRTDFEELDRELRGINVKWEYVRGHMGNPANEAADRLAKQGAEKVI